MAEASDSRTVVVGGGIIGLAVARELLRRRPDSSATVLEKEPSLAAHQTGRNSGVVHAGIYYAPGSEKARLCRRGVGLLRDLCAEHGLPFEAIGKLVVAVTPDEVPRLDALFARAQAAGVPGLERLGPDGIRSMEPNVVGHAALWSPTTAITDFAAITRALATEVAALGGEVWTDAEVVALEQDVPGTTCSTVVLGDGRRIEADRVVVCAGLQTDRVSRLAGGPDAPRIVAFRGEYLRLRPERADLVQRLVYPVPDPQYPFLGVHFTPRVSGAVDIGPNAVLALAREGYRWRDVSPSDLLELARFLGTWRLARQHWRTGAFEVRGSVSRRAFARRAQAYVPSLSPDDLIHAPAGVRAQAVDADGSLVDDFVLVRHGNVLSVRNAPSPGATSSLAIAEHIVDTLG